MVGSRAEKHHSSRVGKNWVMMGFCNEAEETACYTVQQLLRQPQLQLPLLTLSPQHLRGYCTLARLGISLMVRLTGPGDDRQFLSLPPSPAQAVVPRGGSHATHPAPISQSLTLRYSTGLVTLNLSIVVMMIAGVVRKKRRMKRTTLITRQRIHQMKPRMERCSLREGEGGHQDGCMGEKGRSGASCAHHSPACVNST